MSEVLTQDEIDQLLLTISYNTDDSDEKESVHSRRRIKIYDFKRPDVFSREQILAISTGMEELARRLTIFLSKATKEDCSVHVCSIDQLTYEEFIRSIPTPTTCVPASLNDKKFVLEINPSLGFRILRIFSDKVKQKNASQKASYNDLLDSYLTFVNLPKEEREKQKSENKKPKMVNRDLFETESEVLTKYFTKPFCSILKDICWSKFDCKTKISYKNIENNPQFVQLLSPTDMVCLATFEAKIGPNEGLINLCFSKEATFELLNAYNHVDVPEAKALNTTEFSNTKVPIEVLIGKTSKTIKEVMGFGEGTIIELDKLAGEPVDIRINGKELAKGEVVVIDENFGVRIIEMV